jgi:ABC-type ATPase with predicted acetyltransferase domain
MEFDVTVTTPVASSPRLMQVSSLFDVPLEEKATNSWHVRMPIGERQWAVGLITGPSGSGKTSVARHVWPDAVARVPTWSPTDALVDGFPAGMSIKDITGMLTGVGLSSTPAWLRPYHTLSNGEMFRADVARTLADTPSGSLCVIDEFTSFVDRQVARVASHTTQKVVRRTDRQLVAVTCHYDVIDWLQPDWVLDMADGSFTWRSVQPRPRIDLSIHRVGRETWSVFARHHYLSSFLSPAAQCFGAFTDTGAMVAFTSYLHFPHPNTKNLKMAHRIVVLPDYQGLGISLPLSQWVGEYLWSQGKRYRITTAHPAMINALARSPRWRHVSEQNTHRSVHVKTSAMPSRHMNPRHMGTRSFEYCPMA